MFQVSLSSPLVVAVLALTILSGCATNAAPPQTTTVKVMGGCDCLPMQDWLKLQREVTELSTEEVVQRLTDLGPPNGVDQLFYYGLLNQQTDVFTNWAEARDAFRRLAADDTLIWEQRRLAAILERYNQSRINWYEQHKALEEQNLLLQQKIEAITELETTISTRKEQEGHDAPVAPGR